MGRSLNTLKGSDVTVTPIKLKYANTIPSASLDSNGITLTLASNQNFDYNNPSYGDNFLLYRSVRELYYMNYISGSLIGSGSGYEWYPQSTAASGTFDNDYRYFPTESNAQVLVISIPRAKFGENVARSSFSLSSSTYNIVDDGNGNLVDAVASNVHVGNLLYNQGVGIITNVDYLYALTPTPPCAVPTFLPFNSSETTAVANWTAPGDPTLYYEYVYSTSSVTPTGAGTSILADLGTLGISGLTANTTYYFFLRSMCSVSNYSSWVSQSFTTQISAVPLRTGLIGEYYSSAGLTTSSNNITRWNDQSGQGNDLFVVAPTNNLWFPQYTGSYFKSQPGVYLSGSNTTGSSMRTAVTMSGLSGSQQLTVYYVAKPLVGSGAIMEYASGSITGSTGDNWATSTGSFIISNDYGTISVQSLGNVGGTTAVKSIVGGIKGVYTNTVDFTLSTNEATVYENNNSTGVLRLINSNNSGSFDGYKLTVGGGSSDYKHIAANAIIGSILIYNVAHNNTERLQVFNYLTSSYLV